MRLLIQRVEKASVSVDNKIVGSILSGALVLVGFKKEDTKDDIIFLSQKLINLRMFQKKMALSLKDTKKEVLIVPQFTLYASFLGRRPSFSDALEKKEAEKLFNFFINKVKESSLKVETGIFQAEMKVFLINDGPVTFILDSN